ncbi:MAG: radical SAM family heme chaperone HemW [Lysobacterales bacterium]
MTVSINPANIPLSLYVHLPWCVRKCPYCDFNSHQRPAALPEDAYVDALIADLALEAPLALGRPLESIFFGGGTPSLFSARGIGRILDAVRASLRLQPTCEITLETNPGTAEFDRFEGYLGAGVNRLSFGMQSFDDDKLKRLGRIHGADEARSAYVMARKAGFDNINIDLIYGLPGQSVAQAVRDLRTALALEPEHLSHYQLTLEPQTVFARTPPTDLPDEEALADMLDECQPLLAAASFEHYEVSAYAQAGKRSRHNENYWLFGDYLAVGAGAHSKVSAADGQVRRRVRQRTPSFYLQQAGSSRAWSEDRNVDQHELGFEFMLNALRLKQGFAEQLYRQRTGRQLESEAGYQRALARDLLHHDGGRVRVSELGFRFLNDVVAGFLPALSKR